MTWPARTPAGATAGSTGNWPAWGNESRHRRYGRSWRTPASIPRRGGPALPGPCSCTPRPRRPWRATSSRPAFSMAPWSGGPGDRARYEAN